MARIETLIVGGGIGGLSAALALGQASRPSHVIERSAGFGEIEAGSQLAPNAARVAHRPPTDYSALDWRYGDRSSAAGWLSRS